MSSFVEYLETQGASFAPEGWLRQVGDEADVQGILGGEEGAVLVPRLSITPLRATGADRLDFLHGQLSNDVKGLRSGAANLSLMLNHKGHALAQMRVYKRSDDIFLAVEGGAGALVKEQLRAHIIFDQVALEDLTGTIIGLSLQGGSATTCVAQALGAEIPEEGSFVEPAFASAKVLVSRVTLSAAAGVALYVLERDAVQLVETLQEAGAMLAGEDALEVARVSAGIAAAYSEGGEGALPQECGLEHAVSYRKGCYLGQEIMARIESRGAVRKRLLGVRLEQPPAGNEQALLQGHKRVGKLGRWVRHPSLGVIALASVRNELEPGETLTVEGEPAVLCALPFA